MRLEGESHRTSSFHRVLATRLPDSRFDLETTQKLGSGHQVKNFDPSSQAEVLNARLPSTIPTKRQAAARKTELGAWSMFGQVSVSRPRVAQRCLEPHSSQSVSSRALEILCHSQSVRTLLVMFKGWERGKKVSLSFRSCHMSHLLDIVQ